MDRTKSLKKLMYAAAPEKRRPRDCAAFGCGYKLTFHKMLAVPLQVHVGQSE
jgi:hypothetical protein